MPCSRSVQAREENGRVAKKRASEKQREERQRTCDILFKYLSPPTSSYQNVKTCGEGRLHTLTMFVWSHVCNVSVDVKLSKLTNQRVTRSWYTEMRYWNQCLQAHFPVLSQPLRGFRANFLGVQDRLLQGDYFRAHDKVATTSMLILSMLHLFKLVSLIIDLYCRITQAAREAKNGPRKDFQCSIFLFFY